MITCYYPSAQSFVKLRKPPPHRDNLIEAAEVKQPGLPAGLEARDGREEIRAEERLQLVVLNCRWHGLGSGVLLIGGGQLKSINLQITISPIQAPTINSNSQPPPDHAPMCLHLVDPLPYHSPPSPSTAIIDPAISGRASTEAYHHHKCRH
ncbi:hypothetical protein M0R45_030791 [Rubus argutus]|uniref:Uncharacterized protein n=1 Tax=Rubus argutus TaxID=59490 RepID=A0AAW1WG51_RUBAR